MKIFAAVVACLVAASLHAVAEPDGASEVSPKLVDSSVKAALDRGCRVAVWIPYWGTGVEEEEAGVLLSFTEKEKMLTGSRSSRGPQKDLKVLSERKLGASEFDGLDKWLLQAVPAEETGRHVKRVLIENPDGTGQAQFELAPPKSPDDGKNGAAELTPVKLISDALVDDFERERQNPEDQGFVPRVEKIQAELDLLAEVLSKDTSLSDEDKTWTLGQSEICRTLNPVLSQQAADALCHASRIRFFHLKDERQENLIEGDDPGNSIDGYPIAAAEDLPLEDAKPLLAALRERLEMSVSSNLLIFCYSPAHAVKIWDSNGKVICSGTICTHCRSHRLKGPAGFRLSQNGISPALRKALEDVDRREGLGEK